MKRVGAFFGALCAALLAPAAVVAQTPPPSVSAGASQAVARPTSPAPPAPPLPMERPRAGETPAGTTGLEVRPGLELFAQLGLTVTEPVSDDRALFYAFDLTRLHASLTAEYEGLGARVVLEAVRSAAEGAVIGVAGDSLVSRVREGFAWFAPVPWLELRAGVLPTLTVPRTEGTWGLRAVAATSVETFGLYAAADLGASVRATLPRSLGTVAVALYNGEGYTGRELNRGKNLEGLLELHPLTFIAAARPLALLGSLVVGSTGTGLSQSNRYGGGLLWQGDRLRAGAVATLAEGVDDTSARSALLFEGFLRGEPVAHLLLGARFGWFASDLATSAEALQVLGTIGYRLPIPSVAERLLAGRPRPVELYLAVGRQVASAAFQAAMPGSDRWDARLVTRAVF